MNLLHCVRLICAKTTDKSEHGQEIVIHYPQPLIPYRAAGGWSPSQLTLGKRQGTAWTRCQFMSWLTYRDQQAIQSDRLT